MTYTISPAARVIAVGFGFGAVVHATGFALMWLGIDLYGPDYPAWRHVVMALLDASITWIALRRYAWLFVALPAWAAEQALVNGFGMFPVIGLAGVVALAWERWCWRHSVSRELDAGRRV